MESCFYRYVETGNRIIFLFRFVFREPDVISSLCSVGTGRNIIMTAAYTRARRTMDIYRTRFTYITRRARHGGWRDETVVVAALISGRLFFTYI